MTKRTTKLGEPRNDLPGEEWKTFPGFNGLYDISSFGRVYRHTRNGKDGRTVRSRMLKVFFTNGYLTVHLVEPTTGKIRQIYIETLVAELFPDCKLSTMRPDNSGDLLNEIWKDIPGYEGLYQASSKGRIASIGRQIGDSARRWRTLRRRIRKPGADSNGYFKVEVAKAGNIKTISVHRLIALAFIPNPNKLPFVNHKDNNGLNNIPENLEWVSRAENVRHWFDRAHFLTENTINDIAALVAAGKTPAEILASLSERKRPRKSNIGDGDH